MDPKARLHCLIRLIIHTVILHFVHGQTPVTQDIIVDSTFYKNQGPYVLQAAITVKKGAKLTIEGGAEVRYTPSSGNNICPSGPMLKIEGTLTAIGSSGNVITFSQDVACSNRSIAIDGDVGSTIVDYAKFTGFSPAISLRCCHEGSVSVDHSTFEGNEEAISGYMGTNTIIRNTLFRYNRYTIDSADKVFEDCTFEYNQCGVCGVERTTIRRCTFRHHSDYAVKGRVNVEDSIFVDNKLGLDYSQNGQTIKRNLFARNDIGVKVRQNDVTFTENNVCGNAYWNVYYSHDGDFSMINNWFGSSKLELVRGHIRDAYHDEGVGRILLGTLRTTRVPNAAGSNEPCSAPPTRPGWALEDAQAKNIFEDTTWGPDPVIVSEKVTIFTGATLTIVAGTQVTMSASILVKGQLKVTGSSTSHVVFRKSDGAPSHSTGIEADYGQSTVKFAEFRDFNTAVKLRCCNAGGQFTVEDSTFENNNYCISEYMGNMAYIRRCTFRYNKRVLTNADKEIEDCLFEYNECGLCDVERMSVIRSQFKNHTYAAISGRGIKVEDCIIENNQIGYKGSDGSFTFNRNLFNHNYIALDLYQNLKSFKDNNFCNTQKWNVFLRGQKREDLSGNFWGTDDIRLVRSSIRDAYHDSNVGIVSLGTLVSIKFSNPHQGGIAACTAPNWNPDFTLDSGGKLFENTTWDSSTLTLDETTVIYPEATLTISAGARVILNAKIWVKGRLVVLGTENNPVVFQKGPNAKSYMVGLDMEVGGYAYIEQSIFEHFSTAINLKCCHGGGLTIEDSIFRDNGNCITGYMGSSNPAVIRKCHFLNNKKVMSNADKVIEDCVFDSNQCGICGVERTVVRRSLFRNHSDVAVSGRGPVVEDCVIIGNNRGYSEGGEAGFKLRNNYIVNNNIGVEIRTRSHVDVIWNNICGNRDYNVKLTSAEDVRTLTCNWLGAGNTAAARWKILDGFSSTLNNYGILRPDPVALYPFNFPIKLITQPVALSTCVTKPCDASTDCSGKGLCTAEGLCSCLPGWSGGKCDTCDLAMVATPYGLRCRARCEDQSDCTSCLSWNDCGWCITSGGSGACKSLFSDTSTCQHITQDQCRGDAFAIARARFERTGTVVSFLFNTLTNKGGQGAQSFDCALVFEFDTTQNFGKGHMCKWETNRLLLVYLGNEFRLRPHGLLESNLTSITFRDGIIKTSGSNDPFPSLKNTIYVLPNEEIPQPKAIIKQPAFVGDCADLVVDGSGSNDPTGSLKGQWVCESGCGEDIIDYMIGLFCGCTPITMTQNEKNRISDSFGCQTIETNPLQLIIPRRLLTNDVTYHLKLHTANLFGLQSATEQFGVTVTQRPKLKIRMRTPRLFVKRNAQTTVKSTVNIPDCWLSDPPNPNIKYSWTWDEPSISVAPEPVGNTTKGVLPRKTALFILPYTLGFNPDKVYKFSVSVADESDNFEGGSVDAEVKVLQEPLKLNIIQDGAVIATTDNIKLDAVALDPMADESDPTGIFTWKCFQTNVISDNTFAECQNIKITTSEPSLDIPSPGSGWTAGSYNFVIKWSKQYREVVASALVTIADAPSVNILILKPKDYTSANKKIYINSHNKLHLKAVVDDSKKNMSYEWKILENGQNPVIFEDYLLTCSTCKHFILKSNSLISGNEYTFKVNVTDVTGLSAEAIMVIAVAIPPQGGSIVVQPCGTGIAGDTLVRIAARKWMIVEDSSADGSLNYLFGYKLNGKSVALSSRFLPDNEIMTTLPPGDLELWVKVQSITGTEATAYKACKVNPSASTGEGLVNKLTKNIEHSLDNTDELSSAVTTAAQQAKNVGMNAEEWTSLKETMIDAKSEILIAESGVPKSNEWLTHELLDMEVVLTAQEHESTLTESSQEKALQIMEELAEEAENIGIDEDEANAAFSSLAALSGVPPKLSGSRRKRSEVSYDLKSSVERIENGLLVNFVENSREIKVDSGNLQTVVGRYKKDDLNGLHLPTQTSSLTLPSQTTTSSDSVDVTYTVWSAAYTKGVCFACDEVISDLGWFKVKDSSTKQQLDIDTFAGKVTVKLSLYSYADDSKDMACASSSDTVIWTSCLKESVSNGQVTCLCDGLTSFYAVTGSKKETPPPIWGTHSPPPGGSTTPRSNGCLAPLSSFFTLIGASAYYLMMHAG